jgi:hypothetical protein
LVRTAFRLLVASANATAVRRGMSIQSHARKATGATTDTPMSDMTSQRGIRMLRVADRVNKYRPTLYSNGMNDSVTKTSSSAVLVLIAVLAVVIVGYSLLPSVDGDLSKLPRFQCRSNLKSIGLALHLYHDVHGCFPPRCIADDNGTPTHSWRVLILPFLAEANSTGRAAIIKAYESYSFDEPWDGPSNRKLVDQIPEVYRCPCI